MNSWMISLFLCVATFSLVECACYSMRLPKVDNDHICWRWWEKAGKYTSYSPSRKDCIELIKEKCPQMLKLSTSSTRELDDKTRRHDVWTYKVIATVNSDPSKKKLYTYDEKKPACWDDGGSFSDCDYWWEVAKVEQAENKIKEYCIDRIKYHCKNMIYLIQEKKVNEVTHRSVSYEVINVIYERKYNDRAFFNRYVPVMKKN